VIPPYPELCLACAEGTGEGDYSINGEIVPAEVYDRALATDRLARARTLSDVIDCVGSARLDAIIDAIAERLGVA